MAAFTVALIRLHRGPTQAQVLTKLVNEFLPVSPYVMHCVMFYVREVKTAKGWRRWPASCVSAASSYASQET